MPLTQAPWTVIVCRDEEAAVDLINGLLQQRDQQNVCTPPLSKLFCCKAQFVPLFLSSGEWQVILNRHRITLRNSKVKAVFSQICFSKFVSGTCCMGVIASGLLLSDADKALQRYHILNHTSLLTTVRDLLQHPLFYKLLSGAPCRHLPL